MYPKNAFLTLCYSEIGILSCSLWRTFLCTFLYSEFYHRLLSGTPPVPESPRGQGLELTPQKRQSLPRLWFTARGWRGIQISQNGRGSPFWFPHGAGEKSSSEMLLDPGSQAEQGQDSDTHKKQTPPRFLVLGLCLSVQFNNLLSNSTSSKG